MNLVLTRLHSDYLLRKDSHVFVPAILTGLLLWASFFPLDLGPLAFIALVPWLTLVRSPGSKRRRYLAAYVGGLAFFLPALQWIRVAHPMMYFSWIGLALACPLFWVAGLFLIRRIDRLGVVPLAFSVPLVWVALEYTRAHFPTGFTFLEPLGLYQMVGFGWYFLGYTQHGFLPFTQVADLGGVYVVSFLVAMVNGALCEWVLGFASVRRRMKLEALAPARRPIVSTVVTVLLCLGSIVYGTSRLDHAPFLEGPRVAAIQGSVPQMKKMERGQDLVTTYKNLYLAALAQSPRPDLVLWPETCCAVDWFEPLSPSQEWEVPEAYREGLAEAQRQLLASQPHTNVLLGLNGYNWQNGRQFKSNSAVLIGRGGHYQGRYDKMHLVPFGEYVPFKETLPWMSLFTPYKHDYSCRPGERWTRFPLKVGNRDYRFGCLICYEDSDPYLARQYVRSEPVNFIVNISNDGWFDGTEEHEQHLAICRFRAIEARRAIVRSVNMGVSCAIDSDGRVIALPRPGEPWSASKKMEDVMTVVVPIDDRESWYARVGDWLPAACWFAIAVSLTLSGLRHWRLAGA